MIEKFNLKTFLLLILIGFIAGSILAHNWGGYIAAKNFVESDKKVSDQFGKVKYEFLCSFNVKNDHGHLSFIVIGEHDWGTLSLLVKRNDVDWSVSVLDK